MHGGIQPCVGLPPHYSVIQQSFVSSHRIGTFVTKRKHLSSRLASCLTERTRRHTLLNLSRTTRKEVIGNDHMDHRSVSVKRYPGTHVYRVLCGARVDDVLTMKRRFDSE